MRAAGNGGRTGALLRLLRARLRAAAAGTAAAATPPFAPSAALPPLSSPTPPPLLPLFFTRARHTAITIGAVTGAAAGACGGVPREQQLRLALRHACPALSPAAAAAVVAGAGRWPSLAQDAPGLAARCAALQRLLGAERADSLLRRAPDVLTRGPAALEAQVARAAAALEMREGYCGGGGGEDGREGAASAAAAAVAAAAATMAAPAAPSPQAREAAARLLATAPQLLMLPPERLGQRVAWLAELLALPSCSSLASSSSPSPDWPRRLLSPPTAPSFAAAVAMAATAATGPVAHRRSDASLAAAGVGWAVLPLGALAALTRALASELGLTAAPARRGGGGGSGGNNIDGSNGNGNGNDGRTTVADLVLREPRLAELAAGAATPSDVEASVRERLDALRQLIALGDGEEAGEAATAARGGSGGGGGGGGNGGAAAAKVAALDDAVRQAARAHPSLLTLPPSSSQRRLQRLVRALPEVWAAGLVRPRVAETAAAAVAAAEAAAAESASAAALDAAAAHAAAEGRCGPLAVDADALVSSPALAALLLAPHLDVARLEHWDHRSGAGGGGAWGGGSGDNGGSDHGGNGGGSDNGGGGFGRANDNKAQLRAWVLGERLELVAWQILRLSGAGPRGQQALRQQGAGAAAADGARGEEEEAAFRVWAAARGVAREAPEAWGWAREFQSDLRGPGGAFERWSSALEAQEDGWARGAWAWAALPEQADGAASGGGGGGGGWTDAQQQHQQAPFALAELPALTDGEFDARAVRSGLPALRDAVPPPTRDMSADQMTGLLSAAAAAAASSAAAAAAGLPSAPETGGPLWATLSRHRALWGRVEGAAAGGPAGWPEELREWRAHLDAALAPSATANEGDGGLANARRGAARASSAQKKQQQQQPAQGGGDDDRAARVERRRAFWSALERDPEPRLQRLRFLRQVAGEEATGEEAHGETGRGAVTAGAAAAAAPTAAASSEAASDAASARAAAATASSAGLWASLAATDRQFTRQHGPWRYGAWRRLSALVAPAAPWAAELAAARGARLERLLRLASGPRARRLEFLLHSIDPAQPLSSGGAFGAAAAAGVGGGGGGGGRGGGGALAPPTTPLPPPPGDEWRAVGLSEALEADDAAFEAAFPDSRFMAWRALAEMAGTLPLTTTLLPPLPVWPPPPPHPGPPPASSSATAAAAQSPYFYYFADRDEEDDESEAMMAAGVRDNEGGEDEAEADEEEGEAAADDEEEQEAWAGGGGGGGGNPFAAPAGVAQPGPDPPRRTRPPARRGRPRRSPVLPTPYLPEFAGGPGDGGGGGGGNGGGGGGGGGGRNGGGGGGGPSSSSSSSSLGPYAYATASAAAAAAAASAAAVFPVPGPQRVAEMARRAHRLVELVGRCPAWEREARGLGVPAWRGLLHLFTPSAREPRLRFLLATGLAGGAGGSPSPSASSAAAALSDGRPLVTTLRAPLRPFNLSFPGFAPWRLLVAAAAPCPPWRAELEAMSGEQLRALLDDAQRTGLPASSAEGGARGRDKEKKQRPPTTASGSGAAGAARRRQFERQEAAAAEAATAAADAGSGAAPDPLAALRERLRFHSQYRRWTKVSLSDVVRGTTAVEAEGGGGGGGGGGGAAGGGGGGEGALDDGPSPKKRRRRTTAAMAAAAAEVAEEEEAGRTAAAKPRRARARSAAVAAEA